MAFPTIPTAAAGRLLSNVQADTTGTRTFPSLTGLTKNSGDLLIAICIAYQTSTGTNAAFSGWSAGWTEFHDSATSTTMAIGMAYKWSTGSETGTISVTQAATITGHAAMFLLSIPGAHGTTPPEAGSRASGTGAANPASFDPAGWAAEDTLWIAVSGSGETATTGSYTGLASAPTNYSNYADTGISADVVGGVEGAVAFRQVNASSEDVGTFTGDTSNARDAVVVVAVRPAADVALIGSSGSVSTASSVLTTGIKLVGDTPAVSTASSVLTTAIRFAGVSTAVSTADSILTIPNLLFGACAAVSTANSSLTTQITLAGSSPAVSTSGSVLTTGISLAGVSGALSSASAILDTDILLAGSISAISSGEAVLTIPALNDTTLAGSVIAHSEAFSQLVGQIAVIRKVRGGSHAQVFGTTPKITYKNNDKLGKTPY